MTNVVALEPGLEELRGFLKAHGFTVVDWKEDTSAVDAVVYTGRKLESIYASTLGETADVMEASSKAPSGVLIVNAQDKTPQEVLKILTHRAYEHFL